MSNAASSTQNQDVQLSCGCICVLSQVWLPRRPSRLIMATGSVWDVFESWQKAAAALRSVSLQNAAGALLRRALKRKQHRADRGDMSVLVLDFCPESSSGSSFKSQVSWVCMYWSLPGRPYQLHVGSHQSRHSVCFVGVCSVCR